MTPDSPAAENAAPPEAFIEQVRQVLEHLYDFPFLLRHPLTHADDAAEKRSSEATGQRLRRELMAAIESLSPGRGVPFRAPHARLYNLLHLHYVEERTVQEAAHELGLSLRQTYRDLRRGVENVAAILWAHRSLDSVQTSVQASIQELTHIRTPDVLDEMARLETHPGLVDIGLLMQRAQTAVEPLARQRGVTFWVEMPHAQVSVSTNAAVAQQVLISILSRTIQHARPGPLRMILTSGEDQPSLALHYAPGSDAVDVSLFDPVVVQMVERQGWRVSQVSQSDSQCTVTVNMSSRIPKVLVVDDNAGLVELVDRYLTGHACRIVAASSGLEGLQLAQELNPDVIVLDVMMPGMDGWEVLQTLRTRWATAAIPVIVCSVFTDPELAHSLGASLVLSKPVSRDVVLSALRQLGVI